MPILPCRPINSQALETDVAPTEDDGLELKSVRQILFVSLRELNIGKSDLWGDLGN